MDALKREVLLNVKYDWLMTTQNVLLLTKLVTGQLNYKSALCGSEFVHLITDRHFSKEAGVAYFNISDL